MAINENGIEYCYACHAAPCRCGDPHYDDGFHFPPTKQELAACPCERPRTDPTPMEDERSTASADDIRREIADVEQQLQSAELDLIENGGYVPGSFRNMATESRILRLRDRIFILRYQLADTKTRKERSEHERESTTEAAPVASRHPD